MINGISKTSQLPQMQMSMPTPSTEGNPTAAGDFFSVLKGVAADSVDTIRKSELTAIDGIKGKASVQEVVDQVLAAERTLQTTIAVRDKVVAAYQEISRMAI